MKTKHFLSLIVLFIVLSGFYQPDDEKAPANTRSKDMLLYGKLEIGADLNGDGSTEAVSLDVISGISGKQINSILFKSYDDYLVHFEQLKPRIILSSNHRIPQLVINDKPEIVSPLVLDNLGDLNDDGNDEIGYVLENYEIEKTDSLFILTFKNKKWNCIGAVPVSVSSSGGFHSIDTYGIITRKDNKLFYEDRNGKEMELILKN